MNADKLMLGEAIRKYKLHARCYPDARISPNCESYKDCQHCYDTNPEIHKKQMHKTKLTNIVNCSDLRKDDSRFDGICREGGYGSCDACYALAYDKFSKVDLKDIIKKARVKKNENKR